MNKELFNKIEVQNSAGQKFPQGKTVLVMNHIIQTEVREFTNEQGQTNKRMIYRMAEGNEWGMPITLHNTIADMVKKYGDKLVSIEIERKGSGKTDTKYTVMPEF